MRKKLKKIKSGLIHGTETAERFQIVLDFCSIRSEPLIGALTDYYVKGTTEAVCLIMNDISRSKFNRGKLVVNNVACKIERVKEIDEVNPRKQPRKKRVNLLSSPSVVIKPV